MSLDSSMQGFEVWEREWKHRPHQHQLPCKQTGMWGQTKQGDGGVIQLQQFRSSSQHFTNSKFPSDGTTSIEFLQ